ncbi:hypothetical protein P7D15_03405 [Bacillus cereus]|uniref:hypothetical protein n=1 Tax=Bacillus cereus group TaxID=86661 RepID=UPI001F594319|nr:MULTISPECIES: hypothetical protein [Bacillus cereus group]MDF9599472.1 hypothetical protein [Bacillus cereus]MDG1589803.1 hypothetical protein [Bacillus cereus]
MKIKKYNRDDKWVFMTMENEDMLACKWLPFLSDNTMIEIELYKEQECVAEYRAFLTKRMDVREGEFIYELQISLTDADKQMDIGSSNTISLTPKQYMRTEKEMTLRKLAKVFYEIINE